MNHESKTLVILSPGFPKDEYDSTCLPAQQLFVRALNVEFPDLKVIILAFEYPFSKLPYLWHRNRVIPFEGWNGGKIKKFSVWIDVWRVLHKIRKQNELLGLLSFWCTGPALVGKYFSKWHALKHFIWILGQDAREGNRFIPFIRPKASELIAMSDFLAREFQKNHFVFPKHIISNAIDQSRFSDQQVQRDIDILGVGSLIPLKQFDLFLAWLRELKNQIPELKAVICGKGPEENRLRKIIRDLNLQNHVILTGELSHDKVLRWMQRSRVLLHTSSYEGFSTVCLEALYAGAHVVSLCHPMASWVNHWHIADRWEEMPELVQ